MSPRRTAWALIGPGKVGTALGRALARRGWPLRCIAGGSAARARAAARKLGPGVRAHADPADAARELPLVILAVPNAALEGVATDLAARARPWKGRTVLHTGGAASDAVLEPLRRAGASTGRFHPLYPFAGDPRDAERLVGSWFGVSGGQKAEGVARRLARDLGGEVIRVPRDAEAVYHLSAVVASNLLVPLAALAAGLGESYGVGPKRALRALLPLMRNTLDNLETRGLPAALTGPLARGDAAAIEAHLRLLRRRGDADLEAIYRELSRAAVSLMDDAGGLPAGKTARMRRVLGSRRRKRPGTPEA